MINLVVPRCWWLNIETASIKSFKTHTHITVRLDLESKENQWSVQKGLSSSLLQHLLLWWPSPPAVRPLDNRDGCLECWSDHRVIAPYPSPAHPWSLCKCHFCSARKELDFSMFWPMTSSCYVISLRQTGQSRWETEWRPTGTFGYRPVKQLIKSIWSNHHKC